MVQFALRHQVAQLVPPPSMAARPTVLPRRATSDAVATGTNLTWQPAPCGIWATNTLARRLVPTNGNRDARQY